MSINDDASNNWHEALLTSLVHHNAASYCREGVPGRDLLLSFFHSFIEQSANHIVAKVRLNKDRLVSFIHSLMGIFFDSETRQGTL